MLQIKKRKDGRLKKRFMCTICFYQDGRHEAPLHWIRKALGIGYVSRRKDGISELRINGFRQTREILKNLLPFIRFKRKQAAELYRAASLLCKKRLNRLAKDELQRLMNCMLVIQNSNYVTKNKKTKAALMKILDLTP